MALIFKNPIVRLLLSVSVNGFRPPEFMFAGLWVAFLFWRVTLFLQDHSDAVSHSRAINSGANGRGSSMIFS